VGPLRLVHELAKAGVSPVPSRMSAYRVLVRHGLVPARKRKRRRQDYKRWQREEPRSSGGLAWACGRPGEVWKGIREALP
jgi:hypothetical protein